MDVKQYFKDYPGSKQCFQTSDSLIFHEEGDARLHAKSLEDKDVKTHQAKPSTADDDAGAQAAAKAAQEAEAKCR